MDRGYPSSRTCRGCGTVKQSRLLSERTCQCMPFGFACDRDANAALNIQAFPEARSAFSDMETCKAG